MSMDMGDLVTVVILAIVEEAVRLYRWIFDDDDFGPPFAPA